MAAPSDPPDPAAGASLAGCPAEEGAPDASSGLAAGDLPSSADERRLNGERRVDTRRKGAAVPAAAASGPAIGGLASAPALSGRQSRTAGERRRGNRRGRDRDGDGEPASRTSRRRERIRERRQERQLKERRGYWAEVRREVDRLQLEPFLEAVTRLARFSFGESATAMPHLRGKGPRRHMVIIVDAAHLEAITAYDAFEPLERQFWTAFGTIARPAAAVVVAVRPARGWLRSEGKAPLFTQFGSAGPVS